MEDNESMSDFFTRVTKLVDQIKICGEALTTRAVVSKILRSLGPKFDHVVAAIEEGKDLSKLTKEELQGTLESHEQRMNERAAGNTKSDVALQENSAKETKGKRKWFDKGRGGYNNLTGRGNQNKGNVSNQRRPYQGNQGGGVANRGRDGGRKTDKSHIQCYNCQKYGHYFSYCPEKRKNQESDAKFAKYEEEEEMSLMVTTRDGEIFKD